MKNKLIIVSAIYTIVAWIIALLVRFNPGTYDTYSLLVFITYLLLATFGIYAMYIAIIIVAIINIVKASKNGGDKSIIKTYIINSIISIVLVSTLHLSYWVIKPLF